MDPIKTLTEDHRLIERILNIMTSMTDLHAASGRFDIDRARDIHRFLMGFVDHLHLGKEERLLFPCMRRMKSPGRGNGVAALMEDHHRIHLHLMGMHYALTAVEAASRVAEDRFVKHAVNYVLKSRKHIRDEELWIFPFILDDMKEDERIALSADFARFDEEAGESVRERYVRIVDALSRQDDAAHYRLESIGGQGRPFAQE
jgi:hemerythrin-like domain-containing protein